MAPTVNIVIERDDDGFYAWCPDLKGCQSQGDTFVETQANIREAIELFQETAQACSPDFGSAAPSENSRTIHKALT